MYSTSAGFIHEFVLHFSEMTVIRPIDTDYGTLKGCHVDEMLQKHWGSTHTVRIFREPNKSLGISIVGGKVMRLLRNCLEWAFGIFNPLEVRTVYRICHQLKSELRTLEFQLSLNTHLEFVFITVILDIKTQTF